jgi:5'-deoxynucleotidase YfbR-like HD superfamily hydrolase
MPFNRELRELSFVPRWSIVRTIKTQSVAQHSFYVALYAGQVADIIKWPCDRGVLLKYALYHDMDEVFMSDIPGPVKRATINQEQKNDFVNIEMSKRFGSDWIIGGEGPRDVGVPSAKEIIKVADLLDEAFFLASDMQLGNQSIKHVYANSVKRLKEACDVVSKTLYEAHVSKALSNHLNAQSIIVTG